jgi:large subunit ribosomal protein L16
MLFIPKKQKFKKHQKGHSFKKIKQNKKIFKYGQFALKSLFFSRFTSKQIIMLYNNIKKRIKKKGKIIMMIFPQLSVTKKPIEVRMGKGKGAVNFWVARIKAGSILCEISCLYKYRLLVYKILNRIRFKMPFKTKIISRII